LDSALEAAAQVAQEQTNTARELYSLQDFVYDATQNKYWILGQATLLEAAAVNAMIPLERWETRADREGNLRPIKPSETIARIENDMLVESATWWPGEGRIVNDVFVTKDGAFPSHGARMYNLYRPPPQARGNAASVEPFVNHCKTLWPEDAEYLFDYWAHMIQCPHEKCNAAVVMVGEQGVGKDSALYAVRTAIGEWNAKEIEPDHVFSSFNSWRECVMLVINEARPSKEDHRASDFYNILKPLIAAPPVWLPLNDKFARERYVRNVMRVHITMNDPSSLFIPAGDRRMFVAEAQKSKGWADADYFARLFAWYAAGGLQNVAAWLMQRDLTNFNPTAPPPQTAAWRNIVGSWNRQEEDPLLNALQQLGSPEVVFASDLVATAAADFDHANELRDLIKSRRKLAHQMDAQGYRLIEPEFEGEWEFWAGNKRIIRSRTAFIKKSLSLFGSSAEARIRSEGRLRVQAVIDKQQQSDQGQEHE
jgi:hypothetical protein